MKRFTSRVIGILLIGAAALVSVGCTAVPEGVEPVSDFSLDRYLGTWFEIARLDHRFERGLSEVTATYSRRDDGGVRVQNRGFNDETGDWEDIEGKAYFIGSADRGSLKVSFFGPIYGGYHVIALDDAYQHALVSGPDRSYLWILSRTPEMDPQVLTKLTEQARVLDFPVDELILVPHGVEDR